MGHFVVLLPLLIIVSAILYRAHKKDPSNPYAYYFRNFSMLWTACTLIGAAAVVLGGTVYAQLMGAAFSLPFHYIASAILLMLPFALYRKEGILPKSLAALIVLIGLFIGSVIFVKANNLFGALGPVGAFYMQLFPSLKYIRLIPILAVLVPLGLFFLIEAWRATNKVARVRSLLIGIGTIIIGVFGGTHVFLGPVPLGFHIKIAELFVPLGFLIAFGGLLYGFLGVRYAGKRPPIWRSSSPSSYLLYA